MLVDDFFKKIKHADNPFSVKQQPLL
jgi:hypothetical protein